MADLMNKKDKIAFDDSLVDTLLGFDEGPFFEVKRIRGNLSGILESVVAFANSDGGLLTIGLEDPDKAQGRDRVYGLQENLDNWDELNRLIKSRITDIAVLPMKIIEFGCTLRDNSKGSVAVIQISKSPAVHSIVNNGTWIRLKKGNRELTAHESQELLFTRGSITAESQLAEVPFELLSTDYWQTYAEKRKLTRSIAQAMYHIGLAKKDDKGNLKPTRAAVLLFAEEPAGLLAAKATVRIFHYHGAEIDTSPQPNLMKPPHTVTGPIVRQIHATLEYVVGELAEGVHMGPLGFEIVQKYPLRVVREAITNALIHRDYHKANDIQVRLFLDRIEIESPGSLVGPVTTTNIATIGTYARNPLIVNNLREFPNPPNLDAGEGVRMMFGTMKQAKLYPPIYRSKKQTGRDSVLVVLRNQSMPTAWEQVSDFVDKNGWIANKHVRRILETDNTLKASKLLGEWVNKGLLVVANPDEGTKSRRYAKPEESPMETFFSNWLGKESEKES